MIRRQSRFVFCLLPTKALLHSKDIMMMSQRWCCLNEYKGTRTTSVCSTMITYLFVELRDNALLLLPHCSRALDWGLSEPAQQRLLSASVRYLIYMSVLKIFFFCKVHLHFQISPFYNVRCWPQVINVKSILMTTVVKAKRKKKSIDNPDFYLYLTVS